MNCKRRDGYSLVEVCLALLVAGLGIMAVFALFPEGLGQSRKSVEATEIATFADYVFAGLTVRTWTWTECRTAGTTLKMDKLNLTESLEKSSEPQPLIDLGNNANQKFWWLPQYYGDEKSAYIANYRVASFTYSLLIQKSLDAEYEGGALGSLGRRYPPTNMPGKVFYREFTPIR